MSDKYPASEEEFLKWFNDTFPKGNPEKAYNELVYCISTKKLFGRKEPITWEFLKNSYSKYVEKRRKEEYEEKYIKGLESFLKDGGYNIDYNNEADMRHKDHFEKGMDNSMDELEQRLNRNK